MYYGYNILYSSSKVKSPHHFWGNRNMCVETRMNYYYILYIPVH